jgi:hypothetical protein
VQSVFWELNALYAILKSAYSELKIFLKARGSFTGLKELWMTMSNFKNMIGYLNIFLSTIVKSFFQFPYVLRENIDFIEKGPELLLDVYTWLAWQRASKILSKSRFTVPFHCKNVIQGYVCQWCELWIWEAHRDMLQLHNFTDLHNFILIYIILLIHSAKFSILSLQ